MELADYPVSLLSICTKGCHILYRITLALSVYRRFVRFLSRVNILFVSPFAQALVPNYALIEAF